MRQSWPRFKKVRSHPIRGLNFFLLAFFFFFVAFIFKINEKLAENTLSFVRPPSGLETDQRIDLPVKIIIPKVNIDLEVTTGVIRGDKWEISEKGASYLLGSGAIGEKGNAIIYGHNKKQLFGAIRQLTAGDLVQIKTASGKEFFYSVTGTKIVSPQAIDVLAPTDRSVLTLYTCTGFLDKDRFIVRAELQ